jgi:hypothetical protein
MNWCSFIPWIDVMNRNRMPVYYCNGISHLLDTGCSSDAVNGSAAHPLFKSESFYWLISSSLSGYYSLWKYMLITVMIYYAARMIWLVPHSGCFAIFYHQYYKCFSWKENDQILERKKKNLVLPSVSMQLNKALTRRYMLCKSWKYL